MGLWRVLQSGLVALTCLIAFFTARAQPSLAQHLNFAGGTVYEILRDSKGFMWFATSSGLYRYDGYSTLVYKHEPGDENSLSDTFILSVAEDNEGNFWVGTLNGGLNKFIPATSTFIHYNRSSADSLGVPEKMIGGIDKDREGNIWVMAGKLYRINPSSNETLAFDHPETRNYQTISIFFSRTGTVWVGTNGDGYGTLDPVAGRFDLHEIKHTDQAISNRVNVVRGIREDERGNIWLATYGGLVKVEPDFKKQTHWVQEPGKVNSLRHNSLWRVHPDETGKIWIASWGGGVSYLDTGTGEFENDSFKQGGLFGIASNEVRSFFVDKDGTFWFGTNGDGVYKLKPPKGLTLLPGSEAIKRPVRSVIKGKRYLYFLSDQHGLMAYTEKEGLVFSLPPLRDGKPKGLGGNTVSGVAERSDGRIFIGTDSGITEYDPASGITNYYVNKPGDNTSLSHNAVNSIFADSKDRIWAGTPFDLTLFIPDSRQFYKFRNPEFYQKTILHYLETRDGLWLGTATGGLVLFDPDQNRVIQTFQYSEGSKEGLSNNYIVSLFEDADKFVWIGTQQGLNRYHPVKKIVEHIPVQSGLLGDVIGNITQPSTNELLVVTNVGQFRCHTAEDIVALQCTRIPSETGSSDLQIEIAKGANYRLVFAAKQIYHLAYAAPHTPGSAAPMAITQFALDPNNKHPLDSTELNINPAYRKHIVLDYDQNLFSIEFSLLDFADPQHNEYAYMLENFDNTWTYSGTRRFVTYTNISPGTYTFRAKGKGHNDVWNEEGVSLVITILPPPWKTWWAYTAYTLIGVGLLWLARKNIVHRERLKAQVALEQKEKQTLRELDNLKTKFFSNITHEFRTPLTLIQGPADQLLEKTTDKQAVQQLNLIKSNSQRLLKLINQLLDLAKLDANEMKLDRKPVDLAALTRSTLAQFTSMAEARGIRLQWQITEPIPVVMGDAEKLETILINLVSNALKFTHAGGQVTVNMHFDGNTFVLIVEDTGKGIPTEKLAHIFDRFYQVEATDSSHAEGTGIGLALVKDYVELMKGVIRVDSQPGKGTLFAITLSLPLAEQTHAEKPAGTHGQEVTPERLHETNEHTQLPMVLLVEDHEDIRALIKTCLGGAYRYSEANNGKEGLEKARTEIPDLIISDLMMPEMDGMEFCKLVKKDSHTNHIPFVMLTAKASDESRISGLQTGADDYLVKPFNKQELVAKVQNAVRLRSQLREHIRLKLLASASPVKAVSVSEQFVLKARKFVEDHLSDPSLSVESLSAELNLGREQCYRKIMALTGLSPSAFIRKLKLQRAAQLLASKAAPVSQVAYQVGYENLSHFSKAFKEEFGKLPSEYSG